MTKKEKVDLILSKVPEEKKEAFLAEFREAKSKNDRMEVIKKYGATLSKEQVESLKGAEISDQELDQASGGCNCASCHGCFCGCGCSS